MKIGVLSDTHDHLSNLLTVLAICRESGIDTLIHCGDLTGLDMVPHMKGFRVIYTTGNMDYATGAIKKRFTKLRDDNFAGPVFRGHIDGVAIAATHGDMDSQLMDLIQSKQHEWIFHGHTHEKRNEVIHGVRVVNPGALGGMKKDPYSFCIVDLKTNDVEFIKV
jgi:uncharacterized protein